MLALALILPRAAIADTPIFLVGNIFTGADNTSGSGVWGDPISANPGDTLDLRVVAQNQTAGTVATNVKISVSFSTDKSTNPEALAAVSADNAQAISDTVTVNVVNHTAQSLQYLPGYLRVYSDACPQGCSKQDSLVSGGVNVGNLAAGQSALIVFKGIVSSQASGALASNQAPTVVPTPTPAPAAAAVVSPTPLPSGGRDDPAATTEELPKTGAPEMALLLSGLFPIGVGFKKLGFWGRGGGEESALSLWQKREFSRG